MAERERSLGKKSNGNTVYGMLVQFQHDFQRDKVTLRSSPFDLHTQSLRKRHVALAKDTTVRSPHPSSGKVTMLD